LTNGLFVENEFSLTEETAAALDTLLFRDVFVTNGLSFVGGVVLLLLLLLLLLVVLVASFVLLVKSLLDCVSMGVV
jgi:hypothetical protein